MGMNQPLRCVLAVQDSVFQSVNDVIQCRCHVQA